LALQNFSANFLSPGPPQKNVLGKGPVQTAHQAADHHHFTPRTRLSLFICLSRHKMSTPPLLAILLVTSSDLTSPNKHLLFHYPPTPTPQSSQDEEIPDDSSSDASSTNSSSSSSSSSTDSNTSIPSSKYSRQTGDKGHTIEDDEDHHGGFDRDEDDRATSWQPKSRRLTEWEEPLFGLSRRDLADILIPKDLLCNRKFELGVEDLVFLGYPIHLTENLEKSEISTLATSPSSSINDDAESDVIIQKARLTKFHIVFVMNPSWRLDYHDQVQKMYTEIIQKLTDACTTEQKERGYISLEAFKIYKIMRDAEERGTTMSTGLT
jgi:nitrogen permease regulator 3-like protein